MTKNSSNRYFVRSPDGESITGFDRPEAAEPALSP